MTDEHGMLRNGSVDSVGIVRRESTTIATTGNNSTQTNNINNDTNNNTNDNNHENSSRNNGNGRESNPRSPIDASNGNSTDAIVSGNCNKQPNNNTNNYSNNGSPASNPVGGRLQFFKGNICTPFPSH